MKKNISVIIPLKDRFDLLQRALKSINNQTLLPKEVIIIDDFSLSPLKLNFKKYNFKILLIRNKKNFGVSKSRNIGIKNSSGKYLSFIDTDDYWEKNKLSVEYNLLKNKRLDLTYCNHIRKSRIKYEIESSKEIFSRLINLWSHPNCSCLFFNRKSFLKVGYFDEKLKGSEDHDLWFRICKKNLKIGRINKKLVRIEKYNDNQISRNFEIRKNSLNEFFKKYKKVIPSNKFDKYKKELLARAFIPVFNNSLKKHNSKYIFLSLRYLIFSKIFYKRYINYLIRKLFY